MLPLSLEVLFLSFLMIHYITKNMLKCFLFFQRMAKWSSQNNGKYPDPYSKLKLDEEKKVKKKKKKKDKNREKILSQIDPNANNKVCFVKIDQFAYFLRWPHIFAFFGSLLIALRMF